MVFNLQLQVQLLLLEVEQSGLEQEASQADAVLGVAALGEWGARETAGWGAGACGAGTGVRGSCPAPARLQLPHPHPPHTRLF